MVNANRVILVIITAALAVTCTTVVATFLWMSNHIPDGIDNDHKKAVSLLLVITTYLWWTLITIMN
jgi:hypothetical protein